MKTNLKAVEYEEKNDKTSGLILSSITVKKKNGFVIRAKTIKNIVKLVFFAFCC